MLATDVIIESLLTNESRTCARHVAQAESHMTRRVSAQTKAFDEVRHYATLRPLWSEAAARYAGQELALAR